MTGDTGSLGAGDNAELLSTHVMEKTLCIICQLYSLSFAVCTEIDQHNIILDKGGERRASRRGLFKHMAQAMIHLSSVFCFIFFIIFYSVFILIVILWYHAWDQIEIELRIHLVSSN